jgi:hypothetical protein
MVVDSGQGTGDTALEPRVVVVDILSSNDEDVIMKAVVNMGRRTLHVIMTQ